MSFAGHVYDMIRRNKENRELLNRRRDRANDRQKQRMEIKHTVIAPDISVESLEQNRLDSLKRERQDQRYYFRMALLILAVSILILALLWIFFRG